MDTQVIHIHQSAPEKPKLGDSCNGCGVCCLAEPCPISLIMFMQRSGPCPAVVWQSHRNKYECGMVISPSAQHRCIPVWADPLLIRLFKRWIAVGIGCDSRADIVVRYSF
jgi:Fe-S-cluster-containing hydrogenase component 2